MDDLVDLFRFFVLLNCVGDQITGYVHICDFKSRIWLSLLTSEMLAFRFFSAVIVQDLSYMIYQVEILEGFFPVLLSESG